LELLCQKINLAFHVTNMEHPEHQKAVLKPVTLF